MQVSVSRVAEYICRDTALFSLFHGNGYHLRIGSYRDGDIYRHMRASRMIAHDYLSQFMPCLEQAIPLCHAQAWPELIAANLFAYLFYHVQQFGQLLYGRPVIFHEERRRYLQSQLMFPVDHIYAFRGKELQRGRVPARPYDLIERT